jgi:choline-glycine betaine transporter
MTNPVLRGLDGGVKILSEINIALAALLLIFGMSVDVFVQAHRKAVHRYLARLIGLIWCASIALAGLAIWTGIAF